MIDPQAIALEHGFDTVEIRWCNVLGGYWGATCHGDNVGEFGCCMADGASPAAAVAAMLKGVKTFREDKAAIAAGDKAAKARRIEKIKAELESLTGEAA